MGSRAEDEANDFVEPRDPGAIRAGTLRSSCLRTEPRHEADRHHLTERHRLAEKGAARRRRPMDSNSRRGPRKTNPAFSAQWTRVSRDAVLSRQCAARK